MAATATGSPLVDFVGMPDSQGVHANDNICVVYAYLQHDSPLADEGELGSLHVFDGQQPGFAATPSAAMAEALLDIMDLPALAERAQDPLREAAADMLTTIARYAASEGEPDVAERLRRYARLCRNLAERL